MTCVEHQKRHPVLCHSAPVFVPLPKHREYIANRFMKCWHFSLNQSSNREGVIYASKPEGKYHLELITKIFRVRFPEGNKFTGHFE